MAVRLLLRSRNDKMPMLMLVELCERLTARGFRPLELIEQILRADSEVGSEVMLHAARRSKIPLVLRSFWSATDRRQRTKRQISCEHLTVRALSGVYVVPGTGIVTTRTGTTELRSRVVTVPAIVTIHSPLFRSSGVHPMK